MLCIRTNLVEQLMYDVLLSSPSNDTRNTTKQKPLHKYRKRMTDENASKQWSVVLLKSH